MIEDGPKIHVLKFAVQPQDSDIDVPLVDPLSSILAKPYVGWKISVDAYNLGAGAYGRMNFTAQDCRLSEPISIEPVLPEDIEHLRSVRDDIDEFLRSVGAA